jgi:hypothetical protein
MAPQTTIYSTDEIVVAFFNGINYTKQKAKDSLGYLEQFYGENAPSGEKIRYELLYNDTVNVFSDAIEVFEQIAVELKDASGESLQYKYELFFDIIDADDSWYKQALKTISAHVDIISPMMQGFLFSSINNSSTEINYAEHKAMIDNWIAEDKKLLFVAHSQGNLFANTAYDYVKNKAGEESVKVVHVAPASIKLNGKHILADKDLLINGLRAIVGNLPEITNFIPGYFSRPAGINGKKDLFGHDFAEIYLNPDLEISLYLKMYMDDALDSLKAPSNKSQSDFSAQF